MLRLQLQRWRQVCSISGGVIVSDLLTGTGSGNFEQVAGTYQLNNFTAARTEALFWWIAVALFD